MSGQQLDVKRNAGHSDPDILRAGRTAGWALDALSRQIRRLSRRPAVRCRGQPAGRVVPSGPSPVPGCLRTGARHTPGAGPPSVEGTAGETSRSPSQGAILAVARSSDVKSSGGMITRVAASGSACQRDRGRATICAADRPGSSGRIPSAPHAADVRFARTPAAPCGVEGVASGAMPGRGSPLALREPIRNTGIT